MRALAGDGYEVVVADSVTVALALAAKRPFALVLSDFAMPGGDGLGLLRGLRRLQPEARCVLWSAGLSDAIWHEARALGATVPATKLLGEDLRAFVRASISRPPGPDPRAEARPRRPRGPLSPTGQRGVGC
jgi:two-component system response regulator (stage 0 sporulation protein F)